jgi:hypothetical protein
MTPRRRALSPRARGCPHLVAAVAASVVAASAAAPPAEAAQPTKGAKYSYDAPDGTELTFKVSRRGDVVRDIFVLVPMDCSNGRIAIGLFLGFSQTPPAQMPVAADGSFGAMFTVAEEWLGPFSASEEYWLAGRFTAGGRSARLTVRSRHVGEAGTTCDTGDVHVVARRAKQRHQRTASTHRTPPPRGG